MRKNIRVALVTTMILGIVVACNQASKEFAEGQQTGDAGPGGDIGNADPPAPGNPSGDADAAADREDAGPVKPGCASDAQPLTAAAMHRDLAYVASIELGGRPPGSPGAEKAYQFVEERFRCLGILPGGDKGSYRQKFKDSDGESSANVIGIIPGSDPAVAAETIVIGAHIDHFGKPGSKTIRLGANDNASGVTTVLAIAHAIKQLPKAPRRSIAIMAFGSEELGCEGSHYYVEHSTDALSFQNVVYNLNFDMVGTYTYTPTANPSSGGGPARTGVDAQGTMPGTPGRKVIDSVLPGFTGFKVNVGVPGIDEDDSDYWPFCEAGVPFVGFFTDDPPCYHRSCDTEEKIDYENMARIAQIGSKLTAQLGDSPIDLMAFKKQAKVSDLGCK